MRFVFSLVLLLCISSVNAQIERYTLKNGLTVILNEDHTMPQVFGAVAVKAGSKNDPADATGLAHYQEHMLFKGTETLGTTNWEKEKVYIDSIFIMYDKLRSTDAEEERTRIQKTINRLSVAANEYAIPNEFDKVVKMMGGTGMNAFTAMDMTVYFNAFPGNQIERWLDLYAHRFKKPVFRSFQAELEVVYEEKNMRSDNFFLIVYEEFSKEMFPYHPYGTQTAIGTIEHLKNPSLTKMYEFFKTYYVANNMVLVLSGDFNSAEAKKFIEKSWGDLPTGKIPTLKGVSTDPFESAKLIEAKLSPIKIGGLGFHTVPMGHKDQLALEIFHAMLSNSSQSGLLDKLQIDNKLMGAGVIPIDYLDAGATLLFFIPKIIGQKHADAEKLIMDEIGKIQSGAFDDWMLEAAKTALYVDHQKSLENNESVVLSLVNAELSGQDLGGFFAKGEAIRKVSKEEIMQVAKKYYGDNHLSFYSSTGFPAKAKIQKPEYEPVVSKNEGSSEYGKQLMAIQPGELNITPLDFQNDVKQEPFGERSFFYHTINPKNDIFSLNIKFRIGTDIEPMADHVATMMNYAGTDKLDAKALKDEFAKLGISCGISAEKTYFTIQLEGLEENFSNALPLVNALLQNPSLPQDKMSTLYDLAKSDRKLEKSQPEQLAQALFSYLRFGNESPFINRLTLKEIKKLEAATILEKYKEFQTYNVEIHYVGQLPAEEIKTQLEDAIAWNNDPKFGLVPYYKKVKNYTENQVFLVNKKNVNQSQVYFMINPFYFEPAQKSNMDAFNMYFGGGFSGLVVQEIREYRSLAYSAGAQVYAPSSNEFPCQFYGMLGTQADKTLDAIEVFNGLIREMPVKEERLEMIKEFLVNEAQTDVPSFRNRSAYIVRMQDMGYHNDPRNELVERYKDLNFEDILSYYETVFTDVPLVIAIAGDKKRIDVKKLEQYGKVTVLKPKQLLSK